MTLKLQTYVGDLIRTLTTAGQIVHIPRVDDRDLNRYRAATKQVATRIGMGVELRTIDGELYARRTDFPKPPPAMPGLTAVVSDFDRVIATLESLRPWSDDPHDDRINDALDKAKTALCLTEDPDHKEHVYNTMVRLGHIKQK